MRQRYETAEIDNAALLAALEDYACGAVDHCPVFVKVLFRETATTQQRADARAVCEAVPYSLTFVAEDTGVFITPPTARFHATSKIINDAVAVTEDASWQVVGGVVSDVSFFTADVSRALGRVVLGAKTTGTGAQLRVVEEAVDGDGEVDMKPTPHAIPDTSDAWLPEKFSTTVPPRGGDRTYRLEARRNGATTFSLRFASMSLLSI